jgi:hypothetical protein
MNLTYNKLSKLIGIPFKIGKEDFNGCDCVGICWLYHNFMRGKDYPHRDGKPLLIRNIKNDLTRILSVIRTWAHEVEIKDLNAGDIVILRAAEDVGALGVCINHREVLYMNKHHGSSVVKLSYIRESILKGFRPNDT